MSYRKLFSRLRNFTRPLRNYSGRNMMRVAERGMINDIFPKTASQDIIDLCNAAPQCVYAGFDPTADSLHIGNLLVLMNLLHWHRGGHEVIALIGGATARVGDPSGRTKDRDEQHEQVVRANVKSIAENIKRVFDNHKTYFFKDDRPLIPIKVVDNASWYKEKNVVDFICTVGRNFRMGTLLNRSSVEARLASENGMSYTEFSYPIFQAYDWLHLLTQYNCRFQVGGSDQMGNIMSGYELITRIHGKPVFGITVPLITTTSGDKFGKSAGNAIWLDAGKTSPFDFYQYFVRCPDDKVEDLLNYLTFSPPGAIKEMMRVHRSRPEDRTAQRFLAKQVTMLVHGEEGLTSAQRTSTAMYSNDLKMISELSADEVSSVFQGAPIVDILLRPGITVKQCALAAKCFPTENDADRIITAGGFYMNYNRTKNPEELLVPGVHILPNNVSLLRVGKRNFWIIRWLQ
ncbi:tyrosine--tRNA ligase, mitochondrial [Cimex lectularius]|uniref:Tyrosine--tRNA ligase n=1 Tax=Cimex lectularius TaxID=79782 RepID=A0A8I6S393_CIMLE|nr:tyrosine--tRNA ligase, mitochondrial [Cimex lectularius]